MKVVLSEQVQDLRERTVERCLWGQAEKQLIGDLYIPVLERIGPTIAGVIDSLQGIFDDPIE